MFDGGSTPKNNILETKCDSIIAYHQYHITGKKEKKEGKEGRRIDNTLYVVENKATQKRGRQRERASNRVENREGRKKKRRKPMKKDNYGNEQRNETKRKCHYCRMLSLSFVVVATTITVRRTEQHTNKQK
mmetsp:Transcript_32436/g.36291  ORF Transcript_32436/g.36291 Transcript_32436/m.36291 type:complete len:131 (+) Transcript_32436:133-525(+)